MASAARVWVSRVARGARGGLRRGGLARRRGFAGELRMDLGDSYVARRGGSLLLEVLLMILLSRVEFAGGHDLRDDLVSEDVRLLDLLQRRAGGLLLGGIVEEDCRAVLGADIGALAVKRGRIVRAPEDIEQLGVADLRRVEVHQHGLGVTRGVSADVFISGIDGAPAGITDGG